MLGPIQLLAVGFENNERFKGDILRELDEIRSRGVIRLLDMLFVMKDEEGNILTIEDTDLTPEEEVELGNLIGSMLGMKDTESPGGEVSVENSYGLAIKDILDVVDRIEPGTSAGILLIEHVWASGLKHAIVEAGGHVLAQGFLSSEATLMIGKEAEAIAEAEAAIELSEAVKGAALLDVLSTIDTAEELKEAVIEGTSKSASEIQLVKTAAVAEAVRNLVVAGIIDESETIEAIEALVKAGLMDTAALDIAESATEAEA
ncbi:hypothetical protein HWN40_11150 [Methanolobus zinderi]|uniref:DUF1269 domain-containing protein n=1 Tax=Methanolobus zinderi TaxID=536044 RepID=A0A7D5IQR2_9EURY|nr:hypothetical protein [Methanolobus zinderi]QLC50747.1 hypothetical protein HWN40_11150 [Methanolobus zinderi]